jgi:hypothetical protein
MVNTLFHAFTPLVVWTGLGLCLFRFLPQDFPRFLGRSLYWVGGPLQILVLARQTDFAIAVGIAPLMTITALGVGLGLSCLVLGLLKFLGSRQSEQQRLDCAWLHDRASQGSFLLAATLGNTGFVGLGLAPALLSHDALGWLVSYSVTHNLVGAYGLGVMIASWHSRPQQENHWWFQLRDVLFVPSLWAFGFGVLSRTWDLPLVLETGLNIASWLVIPAAFLLIGIRLHQFRGWKSLRLAIVPAALKVMIMPGLMGLITTDLGLASDPRLAVVLMAGMPTAFIGLILAEEYDLDRQLVAGSIALTTLALLIMIPIWLLLFH